ncbi:hypothetical protein HI914_02883 [Erysiphe necator]|nr:hypothetical protein HI914_02883 [Erysiphe necator]
MVKLGFTCTFSCIDICVIFPKQPEILLSMQITRNSLLDPIHSVKAYHSNLQQKLLQLQASSWLSPITGSAIDKCKIDACIG